MTIKQKNQHSSKSHNVRIGLIYYFTSHNAMLENGDIPHNNIYHEEFISQKDYWYNMHLQLFAFVQSQD